jgi:hypothetical protein
MYVKTQNAFFAIAWIQFWMVQRIFISHNVYLRKEYTLQHLKLPLASLDVVTTNY